MSNMKFVADLFLEKEELNRFKKFITEDGFHFDFLAGAGEYGIIHNSVLDPNFDYFRVTKGASNKLNIAAGFGYDSKRNLLQRRVGEAEIDFTTTGIWHWVKISHTHRNKEVGIVSIGGINKGVMTGTNTKFKEVLRGQPNFPSKIKFLNSQFYQQEYEVLSVESDGTAVIMGNFDYIEQNLEYAVIGTFTKGYYPPDNDKMPFNYDDCQITLIPETTENTPPALIDGVEFLLARVLNTGAEMQIIDYRKNYVHRTRLEAKTNTIKMENPLIGITAIKKVSIGGRYFYNIFFDWKLTIANEIQNSSNSLINISLATGGKYKSTADVNTNDFVGWRYYYADGDYSTILECNKTGNSFSIKVDSIKAGVVGKYICPPCDEVEIQYIFKKSNGGFYHRDSKMYEITTEDPILNVTQDLVAVNNQVIELRFKYKNAERKGSYVKFNTSEYYKDTAFNNSGELITPENKITSDEAVLGASAVSAYINVPKFIPLPYCPPVGTDLSLLFDDTGLGIGGEFIGWAVCNGLNNTFDWRGKTPIGATRIDANEDIPSDGANPMIADAIAHPVDLRQEVGAANTQLGIEHLPPIDLNEIMTDPEHDHDYKEIQNDEGGAGFDVGNGRWAYPLTKKTEKVGTGITFEIFGDGEDFTNRQNSKGVLWVCRIN